MTNEAEEDKKLMKMRLEMLQSMVGKLKKDTANSATTRTTTSSQHSTTKTTTSSTKSTVKSPTGTTYNANVPKYPHSGMSQSNIEASRKASHNKYKYHSNQSKESKTQSITSATFRKAQHQVLSPSTTNKNITSTETYSKPGHKSITTPRTNMNNNITTNNFLSAKKNVYKFVNCSTTSNGNDNHPHITSSTTNHVKQSNSMTSSAPQSKTTSLGTSKETIEGSMKLTKDLPSNTYVHISKNKLIRSAPSAGTIASTVEGKASKYQYVKNKPTSFSRNVNAGSRSVKSTKGQFQYVIPSKQVYWPANIDPNSSQHLIANTSSINNSSDPNIPLKTTLHKNVFSFRDLNAPKTFQNNHVRAVRSKYKVDRTKTTINKLTPTLSTSKVTSPKIQQITSQVVYRKRFTLIKKNKEYPNKIAYPYNSHVKVRPAVKYPYKSSFLSRRMQFLKGSIAYQYSTAYRGNKIIQKNGTKKKVMLLNRHGAKFKVAGNLRSLQKIDKPKVAEVAKKVTATTNTEHRSIFTYRGSQLNRTLKIRTARRVIASQLLKKNIQLQQRKKINKTKYCLFYNRFGKCKRGTNCHYIHDPQKVAVCTRFLHGKCDDKNCLFSHKVDPNKMPVCSYFVLNRCSRENCPYRHVNVGDDAEVCPDFLNGYCGKADQCKKKHTLECEEHTQTGHCSKADSCKLIHRSNKSVSVKKKRRRTISGCRRPKAFSKKRSKLTPYEEKISPLKNEAKSHLLPKFINEKFNQERYNAGALSYSAIRDFLSTDLQANVSDDSNHDLSEDHTAGTSQRASLSVESEKEEEFIPLSIMSEDESDDIEQQHDFIYLS